MIYMLTIFLLVASANATTPVATVALESVRMCVDPYVSGGGYRTFEASAYVNDVVGSSPPAMLDAQCSNSNHIHSFDLFGHPIKTQKTTKNLSETRLVVSLSSIAESHDHQTGQCSADLAGINKFETFILDLRPSESSFSMRPNVPASFVVERISEYRQKLTLTHDIPASGTFYGDASKMGCKPAITVTMYVTCDGLPCDQFVEETTSGTGHSWSSIVCIMLSACWICMWNQ